MSSPSPAPRAAPKSVAPLLVCCYRCAAYFGEEGWADCDANFKGSQRKKCSRCRRARHACEELSDPQVVKLLNKAVRTRDAASDEALAELSEGESQERTTAAADAAKAFKDGIRAYHGNKNKMTGDQYTPRKGATSAAHAGPGGLAEASEKTLQSIDRGIRSLVEVGRELVRLQGGSLAAIDAVMSGTQDDDDDDDDDDNMDED